MGSSRRFRFTKTSLLMLPLPDRRTLYHDDLVPGFGLMVSPQGTKTFVLYRKIHGRPERITLGRFPAMTVYQARRAAGEFNTMIAAGRNPAEHKRLAKKEMTFGELFALYLERHAKPHKKTWRGDRNNYRRNLLSLANRRADQIRKSDVQALHARIGQAAGHYTANRCLALIRCVYNKAPDWGYEGSNPASGIKMFREQSRERFLTAEELPRFFAALRASPPYWRDFFLLCLLTGARRANVQAMQWDQIDFTAATWLIPETKSGQSQRVPLCREAMEILTARRQRSVSSPWVFSSHSRTGHLQEPRVAWKRICKTASLEGLRIHDLRRTLGSWQAATGAPSSIIGKTLGHKSRAATAIYERLELDSVRRAVETAIRAMLKPTKIPPETPP